MEGTLSMLTPSIKALVDGYDSLYDFYRGIYKSTYGPSIGFLIDGEWQYCDDLPRIGIDEITSVVDAVSVSSIVEGSDVEVEGDQLSGEFTTDEFWKLVKEVGEEVEFYWKRDNTAWICVFNDAGETVANLNWENFDDLEWDDEGDLTAEEKAAVVVAIEDHYSKDYHAVPQWDHDVTIGRVLDTYRVVEYCNDGTWF